MRLLRLDSSARSESSDRSSFGSHTRRLTERFLQRWQAARPHDLSAGRWSETWNGMVNGRSAPAGLYFVRFHAGDRQFVRRLSVMR